MERSSVERMLRESMEARRVLRIMYRSGSGEATERDIEVRDIQGGLCRAWCHLRHEMRTFRVDRIEEARMLADAFMPDDETNAVDVKWVERSEFDGSGQRRSPSADKRKH